MSFFKTKHTIGLNGYLVALLGARMQYAVPRILFRAGILRRLFTDLDGRMSAFRWLRLLPQRHIPQSAVRLMNRYPDDIPRSAITSFNALGLHYAWRRRGVRSRSELTGIFLAANRAFCRRVCDSSWDGASAVFTFNAAGLEILEQARRRGLHTVCEQTIAPYEFERRILQEERSRHPGWETEVNDNFANQYIERERAEWELADVILCGSEFVRSAIAECGGPAERCKVVPYGIDPVGAPADMPPRPVRANEPLRVLTVGTVGLRKGAPYLLEAAKALQEKAVFRMVGPSAILQHAEGNLRTAVEWPGAVPRSAVAQHFAWADVLLLPSVCEGSATATYEAIASGIPVICTPNTGSVIQDRRHGFIVPIRNATAIIDCINELHNDRDLLATLSAQALRLSSDFTVDHYSTRLLNALSDIPEVS